MARKTVPSCRSSLTRGGGESQHEKLTWSHDVLWCESQSEEHSISLIIYHDRIDDHWGFSQSRTCAVGGRKHEYMVHHEVASGNLGEKLMASRSHSLTGSSSRLGSK